MPSDYPIKTMGTIYFCELDDDAMFGCMKCLSNFIVSTQNKLGVSYLCLLVIGAALAAGCSSIPHKSGPMTKVGQQQMTPALAKTELELGNTRFVAGKMIHRDWSQQRAATANAQYPFAIVLSCIDSRTSSELIFDQGLGDIFNARVAGNVVDDEILGSMEFACKIAGAKLIAVVGHTRCGAIKGACSGAQLGHLTGLLDHIQPAVVEAKSKLPGVATGEAKFTEEVAELNVQLVLKQIWERSPILRELIDSGQVGLVGGIYDLDSGKVQFISN